MSARAYTAIEVRVTEELREHLRAKYGARGVSDAVERILRAAEGLPAVEPPPQGGRFTSERNPGRRKSRTTT